MPYYGVAGKNTITNDQSNPNENSQVTAARNSFKNFLGSPPDVLYLSAYAGDGTTNAYEGNINGVPVVMTSLDITYPSDVDYIPCEGTGGADDNLNGTPFPTVMSISVALQEIHSPQLKQRKLPRKENFNRLVLMTIVVVI